MSLEQLVGVCGEERDGEGKLDKDRCRYGGRQTDRQTCRPLLKLVEKILFSTGEFDAALMTDSVETLRLHILPLIVSFVVVAMVLVVVVLVLLLLLLLMVRVRR